MNETQPLPTDAEIESLWDSFVVDPTEKLPLTNSDKIAFARAVLAKWGTSAPVGVEPVAELIVDRFTSQVRPLPKAYDIRPYGTHSLYTADQALAMGRVPLSEQAIDAMWRDHWDGFVSFAEAEVIVRATEEAHGIKQGGQHVT